jgi:hypothetical protein
MLSIFTMTSFQEEPTGDLLLGGGTIKPLKRMVDRRRPPTA